MKRNLLSLLLSVICISGCVIDGPYPIYTNVYTPVRVVPVPVYPVYVGPPVYFHHHRHFR
jgi:hypothetical protein